MIGIDDVVCKATKEYPYCSLCGCGHVQHDDGFEWIDCKGHYRAKHEPKEIRDKREDVVEVWDIENKVWKKKNIVSN